MKKKNVKLAEAAKSAVGGGEVRWLLDMHGRNPLWILFAARWRV
jgi:hypothetical protein